MLTYEGLRDLGVFVGLSKFSDGLNILYALVLLDLLRGYWLVDNFVL